MQNYHKHDSYSNIYIADSAAVQEDYAKRAVELGHKVLSSVQHGWAGYYFETYELAKKYGLKFIFGAEAYWVKDRHEKDRTNGHIILLAKNENGRRAINSILSTANEDGYYFRPRVDMELLLSLPADDVMCMTACIAFWQYDDIEDLLVQLHNHFKSNLFLEIQYHNTEPQINLNRRILNLSEKYGIEMIVGLDSHYIYPEQTQERDYILIAKNIHYEDEAGWFMDYPDDDTVMQRFLAQNIFTREQIQKAMDNTDLLLDFDDYNTLPDGTPNPIFSKDIKLPTLYDGNHIIDGELFPELSQEERNKEYSKLITKLFKEYMKDVPAEEYDRYFEGIRDEVNVVKGTNMSDYFLIDYYIVKKALENGGVLTNSGRGSAVSYMTNTLLGFSKVDRFKSPIKLYPERFISKSRILESASLPDIDLNWGTPDIAAEAQVEILGENHVYPMIAFGTCKKKSAFKLYARAQNMDFELANTISQQIEKYDDALKYADDDEKDDINIYDYVDEQYHSYIDASQKYWGIIMDKKKAPCAFLLYNGNIREEIGLIKCKSETTKKEYITAVIDGAIAENYKFLKNDILTVNVVLLTDLIFKRIGIPTPSVNELLDICKNDKAVWDIYANGFTMGINQVEKDSSTQKVMKYAPKNISELSAFVAAIRPGFKSMYKTFENREDFTYGIPALDNILQTEELPVSFMFFQEQVMNVLNYAGFPIDQCYSIIKAIAKKHPEKVKPLKEDFLKGFSERIIKDDGLEKSDADEISQKVWTIINDNCNYSFNCVSGSTIISRPGSKNGKFVPTIEEMYTIMNSREYAEKTKHLDLHKKYQRLGYGMALSMFDDEKVRKNRIIDIVPAGIQQTYKVTTSSGCSIVCTKNHRFPTKSGKKMLSELKEGDYVYCLEGYKHNPFDSSFTDGSYEKNYPNKGECGFQNIPDGASVVYLKTKDEKTIKRCKCERCGTEFSLEKHFEVHHKDFDRHNNAESNFEWLCNSCHKKVHYLHGRTKAYESGLWTYQDKIVSIVPERVEMTYDIEMDDPAHTFISENGLIVSNSSHAYCMALDSLYQAWQKAHYPYEFYEVMLQYYSDKGNKDKASLFKQEMSRAFGIKEGEYKFGLDNRKFVADPERHTIYPSLLSIKGLSQGCANDLYSLGKKKYDSFYELWKDLKKKKSLNSAKINTLIEIGYFDDFGSISKIKSFIEILDKLYGRSQFSKSNPPEEFLVYIKKYSEETDKQYRKFDFDSALNEIWDSIENSETPLNLRLKYELDNIGYIKTCVPDMPPDYAFVQEFECKYKNPKLTLYRICDGSTEVVKVRRKKYDESPIDVGDIIKTIECYKEGKWSKDENGDWQQSKHDKEFILKKWSFVRENTKEK